MTDSSRMPDGLDTALAMCLGIYCFVAACFALALYALLQPSTSPNPGLAAYDPPPRTVITYAAPARLKGEPETDGFAAAAIGPEPTAPDQPTKEAANAEANKTDAKKEEAKPEVKAQTKPRRTATRQRERQSPRWDYGQRWDYAAQPSYNNNRPWF